MTAETIEALIDGYFRPYSVRLRFVIRDEAVAGRLVNNAAALANFGEELTKRVEMPVTVAIWNKNTVSVEWHTDYAQAPEPDDWLLAAAEAWKETLRTAGHISHHVRLQAADWSEQIRRLAV